MDTIDSRRRGFSILEILIAIAIAALVIPAVFIFSFGGEATVENAKTNAEALIKARALIEEEQGLAGEDFKLVNPMATATDGIYKTSISAVELPDFLTKRVTANVAWSGDDNEPLSVSLTTLVTDLDDAMLPDTCDSILSGDWTHPQILNPGPAGTIDISPNALTGLAVNNGIAYITGDATSSAPNDFFTVDVSTGVPVLLSGINTGPGLAAVAVAGKYAFVANASVKGQLQVIDISDPKHPVLATSSRLTNIANGGVGNSIFYYKNKVYLGLTASGADNEFNIFDVSNPKTPVWKGGYSIGSHAIQAISVKGNYAYLATADSEQLKILNISDPAHAYQVGGSGDLPDTVGYGESIFLVGNTAYLGRAIGHATSTQQFYAFSILNPALSSLPVLGTPTTASSSIHGLIVRTDLAFFSTNSQFQVWSISGQDPLEVGSLTLPSESAAMDCENNLFYVGLIGSSLSPGHDALKIIGPGS